MQKGPCFFCSGKLNFLIEELEDFLIISDGAPLSKTHILLVPKKHFPCFGSFDNRLINKSKRLKKTIYDFIKINFGKTIIFEHGIIGQTIKHAHIHFVSTDKIITPYLRKMFDLENLNDFNDVEKIYNRDGKYLYFEEDGNCYNIFAEDVKPGFFHSQVLSEILKVPGSFEERSKKAKEVFQITKRLWRDQR